MVSPFSETVTPCSCRLKAWEGVAHDFSKRCLESIPLSKLEEIYEVIASKWKDPETMLGSRTMPLSSYIL